MEVLGKIIGVLMLILCMACCFVAWLFQDSSTRRRREQESLDVEVGYKEQVIFRNDNIMVLTEANFGQSGRTDDEILASPTGDEGQPSPSQDDDDDRILEAKNVTLQTGEEQQIQLQEDALVVVAKNDCAICLLAYKVGDSIVWSTSAPTCPHVFHLKCMKAWTRKVLHLAASCPCCRQPFATLTTNNIRHPPENDIVGAQPDASSDIIRDEAENDHGDQIAADADTSVSHETNDYTVGHQPENNDESEDERVPAEP